MSQHSKWAVLVLIISYQCISLHVWADEPSTQPAATAPASQPASAGAPASQPASQPAAAAETAWPPGLWMDALGALKAKDAVDAMGLRFWGFVETSFMGRLTGGQNPLPGRVFDARRPNELRLNQLRLTAERPYDANKDFDFGFRIDGLYGGDAQVTHSLGLFDQAGHQGSDNWADLLQGYGQIWFKTGKESGLETTFGKWVTPMGYEVIDAPFNALYSHSFLFGYAIPFTNTGLKMNYIWNSQVSTYFAIVEGWDVWHDNNHAVSYMFGTAITSKEKVGDAARDSLNLNIITGPEQPAKVRPYRTVVDASYTHRWSDKLMQTINGDFGTEYVGGDVGQADWYGLAHYLTYYFNDYVNATWRSEWFRDQGGTRTGVNAAYFENTWGVTLTPFPKDKILKNLSFRPELRWDFADQPAFGDDHYNQLTLGLDAIIKF